MMTTEEKSTMRRVARNSTFVIRPSRSCWWSLRWVAILCIPGAASLTDRILAQHPTHVVHPVMQGERLYVHCRLLNLSPPTTVVTPLAINSPLVEERPNQVIELPAPAPPIRVLQFLPNASMRQIVVPEADGDGRPAVELSIEGPTQSFHRWLVADDPERNRLTSFIGSWRFMSVSDRAGRDELLKQFETEFTRDPTLFVARPDGSGGRSLTVKVDIVQALEDLNCKIRVRKFYPDYAMDRTTLTPMNQSDRRRNPAVLVDIEHDGLTETRWVFANFPGFESQKGERLPYQVTLDCPVQAASDVSDFVLVTVGRQANEVWQRDGGATSSRPLTVDDAIAIPHSPYRFRVTNFIPQARMTEEYQSVEKGKGGPALEIEYRDAAGSPTPLWLELGHNRNIATPTGSIMVSFTAQGDQSPQEKHP